MITVETFEYGFCSYGERKEEWKSTHRNKV